MPTAYILINVDLGHEQEVVKQIRTLKGLIEAQAVYGVYDVIAKASADTMDKVKETIVKMRQLPRVKSTLTMIVIEE